MDLRLAAPNSQRILAQGFFAFETLSNRVEGHKLTGAFQDSPSTIT